MGITFMSINEFFAASFGSNTGAEYARAIVIFLIAMTLLKFFQIFILSRLKRFAKKTTNDLDDLVVEMIERIKWPFFILLGFYISTKSLEFAAEVNKVFDYMMFIIIVYYVIVMVNSAIDYIAKRELAKRNRDNEKNASMIGVMSKLIKIVVVIIAALTLLANLGINITSIIAGLGVGGIAVAFALQRILEDVFSSFSIYFDKPFEEGDFIIIGDDMGTVKHIGLKTTRLLHLEGQELVVSNRELTSIRINNYKKMERRRIQFRFGVEYSTPIAKMKKINNIIKGIFDTIKITSLERVHFKAFGDSSLNFEVVYYLASNDYGVYMDTQQEINLKLMEKFQKEKIEFAFPTQTIFLKK